MFDEIVMFPQRAQVAKCPTSFEIEIGRMLVIECCYGNFVVDVPLTKIIPRHARQKLLFKVALELIQIVTEQ